jgi:hypothetical protein
MNPAKSCPITSSGSGKFIADFHGRENNQLSDDCRGQW